ncbi:hypothetical protein ACWCQZ_43695 [Streptomyces sp. NPDC002285]
MNRDNAAGRRDDTESVVTAATRAWNRVPRATRCKFNPKGRYTTRVWEGLLYHVARDTNPELRPVLRHDSRGELTAAQAEQLVAAIVVQTARLDRAGDWVQGLKAAHGEVKRLRAAAGKSLPAAVSSLSHRIFPAAWARSAEDCAMDADECLLLFQNFAHDDPGFPPPTHAAFKALFAQREETEALDDILAAFAPAAEATGHPVAVRNAEALLLDAPLGADWERLWARYTLLRPWERHLTAVHATGLSRHAVPARPTVQDDRQDDSPDDASQVPPLTISGEEEQDCAGEVFGHSESTVLPLDRSIWRRLDHSVRTLASCPSAAGLTAREVVHDEARRALAALGLANDEQRSVLCLGIVSFSAVGAEHSAVLLAKRTAAPRLLTDLAELTERKSFVATTLRIGAAQHAPVRRALEDPLPGCTRLLWRMLHSAEIRQEDPPNPDERWIRLIRTAANRYLQVLRGELKLVLSGTKPAEAEEDAHLAGDRLENLRDDVTSPDSTAPVLYRGPHTHQIVVDVIVDGLEQRGINGAELVDWVHRFIDPLHHDWAEPAWGELYAEYQHKHQGDGGPVAFPPVPFESARDIVRSLYRPEAGGLR